MNVEISALRSSCMKQPVDGPSPGRAVPIAVDSVWRRIRDAIRLIGSLLPTVCEDCDASGSLEDLRDMLGDPSSRIAEIQALGRQAFQLIEKHLRVFRLSTLLRRARLCCSLDMFL